MAVGRVAGARLRRAGLIWDTGTGNDKKRGALRYDYILDRGETSWGGRVPAVPGAFSVGKTREEAERLLGEAVECVLDVMRERGQPPPALIPFAGELPPGSLLVRGEEPAAAG